MTFPLPRPGTEQRARSDVPIPKRADYPCEPRAASLFGGSRVRQTARRANPAPLVSIVTIVRNGAAKFARAAESVLTQDYPAIEYIVVDGGSTDGTLDLIQRLDGRIAVWVSEPMRVSAMRSTKASRSRMAKSSAC